MVVVATVKLQNQDDCSNCGGDGLKWKFTVIREEGCRVIRVFYIVLITVRANWGLLAVIGLKAVYMINKLIN